MAIIDTITTIAEVCALQGHDMNTIINTNATRLFSDTKIESGINNVIRFVYGNSDEDLNAYLQLFCINTLSVIHLNNIMYESGKLQDVWEYVDPFDKDKFYKMIELKKADDSGVDVIPLYRNQFSERYV